MKNCIIITKVSHLITSSIERFFYRLSFIIAKWPWTTILISCLVCAAFSGGLFFWYQETDNELLWTPYHSPFLEQKNWIRENFPRDRRLENMILLADENVLTANQVKYFLELNTNITNHVSPSNKSYGDLCFRYPGLSSECQSMGIFGIFKEIPSDALTDKLVSEMINQTLNSEIGGSVSQFLSGVKVSETTGLLSAQAVLHIWIMRNLSPDPQLADEDVKLWEEGFINVLLDHTNRPVGLNIFGLAERSYDDEISYVVNSNMGLLLAGFVILFVYVSIVLGNFNWIEQRAFLSFAGMIVIGLSLGASFGLSFYLGLSFNDMCPVIPFLLLGIGVDDMFVIVQCLDNLEEEDKVKPVEERVAKALQHAGVSITVTSVTDAAVFFIGATSSMPIMRVFCYFSGLGVIFLYFFAVTFFVACLSLDEGRVYSMIRSRPQWSPPSWTRAKPGMNIFTNWISPTILKWPVSILIVVITVALAAGGIYGLVNIESDYDSIWYMRHSSYQYQYYQTLANQFKGQGERVDVYLGGIDYEASSESLVNMTMYLEDNIYISKDSVIFWYEKMMEDESGTETNFMARVGNFLSNHTEFLEDVRLNISTSDPSFADQLSQGHFVIQASRATFQHIALDHSKVRNAAMDLVKTSMNSITFSKEDFPHPIVYNFMYVQWGANKIISKQLIRNLILAGAMIAVFNLILIADFIVSCLVFICVLLTIVDIAGGAFFMGLTIEIVTSIVLLLSVGLALDYSAHLAVTYVMTRGTDRKIKAKSSLSTMGMAVANGGISTLLAFILVSFSSSYVFLTFFKMFLCVVVFGLFHGLFLLPVLLSWVGSEDTEEESPKEIVKDNEYVKEEGEKAEL